MAQGVQRGWQRWGSEAGEDSLGPVRMAEKGWSRVGGRATSRDHPSSARRRGNPAGTVWGKRFCQPSGAGTLFLDFRQRWNVRATAMPRSKPIQTRSVQVLYALGLALFRVFQRFFKLNGAFVIPGIRTVRITFRDAAGFVSAFPLFLDYRAVIARPRDKNIVWPQWKSRTEPSNERTGPVLIRGHRENRGSP